MKKQKYLFFITLFGPLLFIFLAVGGYYFSTVKKGKKLSNLQRSVTLLESEKIKALNEKEDLLLKIASQDDPCYIELVLTKELGVVPEGQMKVYFRDRN